MLDGSYFDAEVRKQLSRSTQNRQIDRSSLAQHLLEYGRKYGPGVVAYWV